MSEWTGISALTGVSGRAGARPALQRHVRSEMLGRVASITTPGTTLANPIAPLTAGLLVQSIGPSASLMVAGIYAAIIGTVLLFLSPLRRVR